MADFIKMYQIQFQHLYFLFWCWKMLFEQPFVKQYMSLPKINKAKYVSTRKLKQPKEKVKIKIEEKIIIIGV